ncbi:MAG: C-GCAxxG-C-C family protein [Desulfobacterales bacterium]
MTRKRLAEEIIPRMIELAENGYNCSQILVILALEREGKENTGLVRAMSGLGDGCGFFKETCGVMTGAASLISWYAGKGSDGEKESERLLPMLEELGDWFREQIGEKYNGTRCEDIVGKLVGTTEGKQICGGVLFRTYEKVNSILVSNGFVSEGEQKFHGVK